MTFAQRTTMTAARDHFNSGGTVMVSERGHNETLPIGANTVVHNKKNTTWEKLREQVEMWRGRHPNQRYYIVVDQANAEVAPPAAPAMKYAAPSYAADLSLQLDLIVKLRRDYDACLQRGEPVEAFAGAYMVAVDRVLALLKPRELGGETSGVAVTIMGLDLYVHDQGAQYAVSVNADEAGKSAVVESFDGISWEKPLPGY